MCAVAKDGPKHEPQVEDAPQLLSRPLESLVFLLPLILFYEIGCLYIQPASATAPGQERVVAFHLLQVFFELFGSTGVWMPGMAVVIILLCTHLASRKPWEVRRRAVGMMYAECAALALPLLLFNSVLRASPVDAPPEREVLAEAILGVGAGVYEELVFRLILVSLIYMVAADFMGVRHGTALVAAVLISSVAFSAHHYPPLGSDAFSLDTFAFRTVAGVYLGALFVYRGYGPAAGTHAVYNLLVTLIR